MLFNSIHYAFFLPVVFFLYWFATKGKLKFQNSLLLIASYFFYACWDYRFLFLLIFSTLLDYYMGIKMSEANNKKIKVSWFWLSIAVNVGFLGVFKYYNFFAESFKEALSLLGIEADFRSLNIILPVGISFYTFHGLSYVIDIYKNKIKPERNFIDYSLFVSFFPLLVAGPIERATHLLPQIKKDRFFDYSKAIDGLRQIVWGLFKKMVIADNCAKYANVIFNNSTDYDGSTLIVGAIFFTFQIYCDFSGYSDIAIGTARLFGIDLLRNFAFPYFSRDIAEFWRRWHISLSTWFRDYLYIPLGGSKGGTWLKVRNTFIIFIVSGFWHGANWTFIMWGLLNALYIMPSILNGSNRNNLDIVAHGRRFPDVKELTSIIITFGLTVFAWIFFRAENITNAFIFIKRIFSGLFHKSAYIETVNLFRYEVGYALPCLILMLLIVEWIGRERQHALAYFFTSLPKPIRYSFYYFLLFLIFVFNQKEQQFIYFQF